MSTYLENFDFIIDLFGKFVKAFSGAKQLLDDSGLFTLAKGLKDLTGMWK